MSWLREYVDIPYSIDELEERFSWLGLGVEGVERTGRDDAVFDLEIAANRGELMSHLGVARELAAAARTSVRPPAGVPVEEAVPAMELARVHVDDRELCPRFTARMILEVKVGPSPAWLAGRLEACGIRSINNIVDVTNYVMLETGQPMHAFDHDRLQDGRLIVRQAHRGEPLVTLDGVERQLDPQTLVVADGARATSIAGIIGGASSEITSSTHRVLLEAAVWQPAMIRRTSKRLGVRTESSARFERGVDYAGVPAASTRAIRLIQELAGGRVLRGLVDINVGEVPLRQVQLRWPSVSRLLGMDVPMDEGVAILRSLGFSVKVAERIARVVVPSYRRDVEREEDLVEEVARHYGYDRIPETMPVEITAQGSWAPSIEAERAVRDALIRVGLTEVLTVSLTSPAALDALRLPQGHPYRNVVPIRNPMVEDHVQLRTTLLPGLLHVAGANTSHRVTDIQVFEVGRTFHPDGEGAHERRALGVLMTGTQMRGTWNLPSEAVTVMYHSLKGAIESLLGELRVPGAACQPSQRPWLHPGRAASLDIAGETIGTLGELHPEVIRQLDLPAGTCVAEVNLDALLARAVLQPRFAPLPRFPSVRRDISLVVDAGVTAAQVEAVIRAAGGPLLEGVEVFDVYSGAPIPAGNRNLAYALRFRSPDRTLTAEEVAGAMAAIARALEQRLKAKIRE
ncbi:MAG: phenylalanine--tRNA ligase subunit beta [Armatimonadetes bacterium]|nr:phenylalanine--tRNA ligase subunit beta [Armatimonadota bacterium]